MNEYKTPAVWVETDTQIATVHDRETGESYAVLWHEGGHIQKVLDDPVYGMHNWEWSCCEQFFWSPDDALDSLGKYLPPGWLERGEWEEELWSDHEWEEKP